MSTPIVVAEEGCRGCGSCAKICHEQCITLVQDRPEIDGTFCSTCAQCIAICPQQVLSWDGTPPVPYDRTRLPSPEQLDELFKERRTIRFFKRDKIDRALLKEIVRYGIYAPTNNYDLRAIVIDDQEIIAELDRHHMRLVMRIYNAFYRPKIVSLLAKFIGLSRELVQAKPKIEDQLRAGHAFPSSAAVVFIVGDKRIPLSGSSAQYALCNMMYYAQAKGIGTRLWGPGELMYDRIKAIRECLGLGKREHILGTLLLGYPAVRFANKVEGKRLPIQWNEVGLVASCAGSNLQERPNTTTRAKRSLQTEASQSQATG